MRALGPLMLAALLAAPGPAAAAGFFCRVRERPVSFGDYHASRPIARYAIGLVQVECPRDRPGASSVSLSTGQSGRYDDRTMQDGRYELHYNLYADPARRLIAGDGSAGTVRLRPVPLSHGGLFAVFGTLPANQVVREGFYQDTIVVTVEF